MCIPQIMFHLHETFYLKPFSESFLFWNSSWVRSAWMHIFRFHKTSSGFIFFDFLKWNFVFAFDLHFRYVGLKKIFLSSSSMSRLMRRCHPFNTNYFSYDKKWINLMKWSNKVSLWKSCSLLLWNIYFYPKEALQIKYHI